jgi:hypothetical protein
MICARNGKNKGTDALDSCVSYSLEYTDTNTAINCVLSNSKLGSDKGILASGCVGDSTLDNPPCVKAGAEVSFANTDETQGFNCISKEYKSHEIFIAFRSSDLRGKFGLSS